MKPLAYRPLISLFLISSFVLFSAAPKRASEIASPIAGDASRGSKPLNPSAAESRGLQFKRQPLRFEVNAGQTDSQVRFIARASDSTLFLTASEAVLCLPKLAAESNPKLAARKAPVEDVLQPVESATIRLRPVGANAKARIIGVDKLAAVSNYFIGNDPREWRTKVESYEKVKYENLYPGIDLIYYGNEAGELEYDFKVAPGADPGLIAMSIEGAGRVEVDSQSGDLLLSTTVGRVRQHAPLIYQEVNGRRQEIVGRYRLVDGEEGIRNPQSAIRWLLLRSLITTRASLWSLTLSLSIRPYWAAPRGIPQPL